MKAIIFALGLCLVILATACSPVAVSPVPASNTAPTAAPAPTTAELADPIEVVKEYYESYKAHDADKTLSFLDEHVMLTSPQGISFGKTAARKNVNDAIGLDFHSENSNYRESNGEVRYDYQVFFGDNKIDQNTDGLTIVKNGKIVFDGLDRDNPNPAANDSDAIKTVKTFSAAINQRDTARVMELLADDAVIAGPAGTFKAKEAIGKYLQALFDQGYYFANAGYREENGMVRFRYTIFIDDKEAANGTDGLVIVRDGKVVFDGLEKDNPLAQ